MSSFAQTGGLISGLDATNKANFAMQFQARASEKKPEGAIWDAALMMSLNRTFPPMIAPEGAYTHDAD